MPFTLPRFSAGDEGEDLLGEGNDDAACYRQHTVGALGGIVALEDRPTCKIPKPSRMRPMARISEKMKSDRLLTTVSGSSAASAGTAVATRSRQRRQTRNRRALPFSRNFVVQIMFHAAAFSFSVSKSIWNSGSPGIGGSAVRGGCRAVRRHPSYSGWRDAP